MMYDLMLSWRTIRAHPVQTLVPVCVVALAIALSIAVLALGAGVRDGIVIASDPFGVLVVGPKGDSQQLVLNTVLLQGLPVGTIPVSLYEQLANDPRAQLVVPLAVGDNIGGAPIIGTNDAFFSLRRSATAPPAFQLAEGALFEEHFQAVLGSRAARSLGLRTGDTFQSSHGFGGGLASDVHQQIYTVVGILQPTNTPYDGAVYTTIESIWEAHDEGETDGAPSIADVLALDQASVTDRLTSVLVLPTGFIEQNQLMQEFYVSTEAQAVAPGEQIGGVFDLLRQGEQILTLVGYLVLGIAALTVFLALYSVTVGLQQEIAIMRSLGSSRANVFRLVILLAVWITLLGALAGRLIGYGVAFVIGAVYTQQSAIPVVIRFLPEMEPLLWLLPLGVGVAAGMIPAARAYSVDVVQRLFPT